MRYKELNRVIPDISQKMLSSTLKRQEENKLINLKMLRKIPPRVIYTQIKTGKDLMPAMDMIIDWVLEHFDVITKQTLPNK